MTHRRRRASRVLLAVLALTITVGLLSYVHRVNSGKASRAKAAKLAVAAATTSPATAPTTSPAETPLITRASDAPPAPAPALGETTTARGATNDTPGSSKLPVTEAPTPLAQTGGAKPVALAAVGGSTPSQPAGQIAATPAAPPQKVVVQANAVPAAAGSSASSAPGGAAGSAGSVSSPAPAAQSKAKGDSANLLEARDAANASLASGRLPANDVSAARQKLAEINQTVVFSNRRFPDDRWGGTYVVQPGDRLDRIGARYGVTPSLLMKLNGIADARKLRAGATIKVIKGPFHAVVHKSSFRLDLYLGSAGGPDSLFVTSFPVGLGKDDSTPMGTWLVAPERKLKNPEYYSPRGEGIIAADDPKNPLGDYWIGLDGAEGDARGKQSYGIHGTIEPDSIGKQASMGCVRMRNEDVAVVFDALTEGKSTVLITN